MKKRRFGKNKGTSRDGGGREATEAFAGGGEDGIQGAHCDS